MSNFLIETIIQVDDIITIQQPELEVYATNLREVQLLLEFLNIPYDNIWEKVFEKS